MTTTNPAGPDCIGPIRISRSLAQQLDGLAAGVAADALAPYWICATELAQRASRDSPPVHARVIRGQCDAVTAPARAATVDRQLAEPATTTAEARISFRTALRLAARQPPGAHHSSAQVDLAVLISVDGERMYLERMSMRTDGPGLAWWGQRYLQLLNALADRPDELEIADALQVSDHVPVPAAS